MQIRQRQAAKSVERAWQSTTTQPANPCPVSMPEAEPQQGGPSHQQTDAGPRHQPHQSSQKQQQQLLHQQPQEDLSQSTSLDSSAADQRQHAQYTQADAAAAGHVEQCLTEAATRNRKFAAAGEGVASVLEPDAPSIAPAVELQVRTACCVALPTHCCLLSCCVHSSTQLRS